jgi:hypothetical protein
MSEISKQALKVDNTTSFPNNTTGYISPTILRAFNVNVIDSTVNQVEYTANSGSWNLSIGQLNAFTASQQPSFTALNSFTASQLTINSGVNLFTQSAGDSISRLSQATSSLQNFTSSINQIIVNGSSIGTSTRLWFNGFVSASIVQNVGGPIASITILADQTFTPSASINAYTASTNVFTASAKISIDNINSTTASLNSSISQLNASSASQQISINELNSFTASLDATYATDAQLQATASTLQTNIDTKLNTASFDTFSASVATSFSSSATSFNSFTASQLTINTGYNSYTASNDTKWNTIGLLTGSYATTGSNSFRGNQTISGSFTLTGSVYSNVISASIVSSTASIDLSKGNFFTLTLPASLNTHIDIQNVSAGQTALIEITTAGTLATASFSTNVYQPSASFYVPTNASGNDILTLSSFASNKIYLASVKTMINA